MTHQAKTAAALTTTTTIDDTVVVLDADGGTWIPSDEAAEEILASADPDATAVRICQDQPLRGEWSC